MGIPHRHGDGFVSHKLLDRPNVHSGHHKAAGERMPETMPAKRSQTGSLHDGLKPAPRLYRAAAHKAGVGRPLFQTFQARQG